MATKKEVTVENKLRALYDLQLIDSRVDEIRNVRGELPLEVEDLEDEVSGLNTRMEKLKSDLETINVEIAAKKNLIENLRAFFKGNITFKFSENPFGDGSSSQKIITEITKYFKNV